MKLQFLPILALAFAAMGEGYALFDNENADHAAAQLEASRGLSDEVSYSMSMSMSMSMSVKYTDKCGEICRSDMQCDEICPYCQKEKGKKNGKCVEKVRIMPAICV